MSTEMFFNDTSEEDWTQPPRHDPLAYIVPIVMVAISIVGLLTNGALVFVLSKTKVLNAPNAFILNLVVADLLAVLLFIPAAAKTYATTVYPFPEFVCKTSESAYSLSNGLTAFSLVALGVHTYRESRATTATLDSGRAKRNTVVAVAVIWLLSIALSVPTMLKAHVYRLGPEGVGSSMSFCTPSSLEIPEVDVFIRIARIVVIYVIPLAACGVYLCLANRNGTREVQRELLKMSGVLTALYAGCFVTAHVFSVYLALPISDHNAFLDEFGAIGYCQALAYHCLNPVALYCASGAFRQLFSRHLLCWCTSGNREPVPRVHELASGCELPQGDVRSGVFEILGLGRPTEEKLQNRAVTH